MKQHTKNRLRIIVLSVLMSIFISKLSFADGNHTWAKSEAWTWMGHLSLLNENSEWKLQDKGYAFIHYFTRNETGMGRMNFKSSAVTKTSFGVGTEYDQSITYPEMNTHQFQLKVSETNLDIEFQAPGQRDRVQDVPMTDKDLLLLKEKILPLYPGLKITNEREVKKTVFTATMGKNSHAELTFYSIWPDVAPPNQQMTFYGLQNSYTFSSPMLVAYGTWREKKQTPQKVVGLCFLDRQWSKDYFGKNIFNDVSLFLKKQQALKWAHNWSAFHAWSPETQDWYFVHLWRQVQRRDHLPDQMGDYTGIQWSKNGEQQPIIDSKNFSWIPNKFVKNRSQVLLNFAEGRKAFFPYRYQLASKKNSDINLNIEASPQLQSLDQPIYLYEGYASGFGTWDNKNVLIQGRVESSQILFRNVDYADMLARIDKTDAGQIEIATYLESQLIKKWTFQDGFKEILAQQKFLGNDIEKKLQIFSSQFLSKPKRINDQFMVYY